LKLKFWPLCQHLYVVHVGHSSHLVLLMQPVSPSVLSSCFIVEISLSVSLYIYMEQNSSWQANSWLRLKEISGILCDPKIHPERKWEAQLEWSQVYRQEPRRLEKICKQPMFLMELRTLLLLLLKIHHWLHDSPPPVPIIGQYSAVQSSHNQLLWDPF
jgi:hypothetical protein